VGIDTENKSKGDICKVLCTDCKHETNHEVLYSLLLHKKEEFEEYSWHEDEYQVVRCLGCNEISFRIIKSDSELQNLETGYYDVAEIIYPRRTKETINGKIYLNLPSTIKTLYNETIDCYNNNILLLCAAGLRSLIEGICQDKESGTVLKDDGTKNISKNLEGKINGLYKKGILTEDYAKVLHEHRYLGNKAVHELSIPSRSELELAIGIIEHILDSIYEIPAKGNKLMHLRKRAGDKT
jgi:ribosomal protein S27E